VTTWSSPLTEPAVSPHATFSRISMLRWKRPRGGGQVSSKNPIRLSATGAPRQPGSCWFEVGFHSSDWWMRQAFCVASLATSSAASVFALRRKSGWPVSQSAPADWEIKYNMWWWAIDRRYIQLYCNHPSERFSPHQCLPRQASGRGDREKSWGRMGRGDHLGLFTKTANQGERIFSWLGPKSWFLEFSV
jgi:hypothetical protein